MAERIHLAANNPDLGGGEQMLVRTAVALLELGRPVSVVAPDSPSEVLDAAVAVGADVVAIRADGRRDYLHRLRSWDRRERSGLLWCHGLVPALATAGHRRRVVHLHQDPRTAGQRLAAVVARAGALATLVPSDDMARRVRGSRSHPNWTSDLTLLGRSENRSGDVGFLGRVSTDKGVDVLARSVELMPRVSRLVVGGDSRYVPAADARTADAALASLGRRVVRMGHVAPVEVLRSVDLMVFPSVWAEPFGLVVAEAMAAGVPFAVSDAGALPEVAGPDHPWVARAGDPDDLARVITAALAASADDVRSVTARARARWEELYSPDAGRRRVARLLDELGVR